MVSPALSLLAQLYAKVYALATTFLLYVLALGPLPQHVGFVMDGNRRYARVHNRAISEGHGEGFESLKRTLEICLKLNIPVISIYAFAIDNFSREEREVKAIIELAKKCIETLCQQGAWLEKYGIKVKVVGRVELLPPDVQEMVVQMEELTRENKRGVLNVCCPYASRDEITTAVKGTVEKVYDGRISAERATDEYIFDQLPTCQSTAVLDRLGSGKLDILVRTSDVKRLSDFMLWQVSQDTQLHFIKTYWPDFGLKDMLPILLGYQQKAWLRRGRGITGYGLAGLSTRGSPPALLS